MDEAGCWAARSGRTRDPGSLYRRQHSVLGRFEGAGARAVAGAGTELENDEMEKEWTTIGLELAKKDVPQEERERLT
eukprot:11891461-Heterocapsa_arctica.AAC.1